ncbi:MAG TPA: hypothetical protein DDY43_09140 [Synechococcales bacterium UBA10510]|nr:hypothetical protein [Synechococcales bacterium UBA10510]
MQGQQPRGSQRQGQLVQPRAVSSSQRQSAPANGSQIKPKAVKLGQKAGSRQPAPAAVAAKLKIN